MYRERVTSDLWNKWTSGTGMNLGWRFPSMPHGAPPCFPRPPYWFIGAMEPPPLLPLSMAGPRPGMQLPTGQGIPRDPTGLVLPPTSAPATQAPSSALTLAPETLPPSTAGTLPASSSQHEQLILSGSIKQDQSSLEDILINSDQLIPQPKQIPKLYLEGFSGTSPPGESKMRLRPWLEKMINAGEVMGLEWLDKERTHFKIPWKHRSKKDWNLEHIKIFLEWAKHTGKYHEGEKADFVAMKTRLRCAFNKAPDIQEVKHLHRMKCAEPYKVYKFLPKFEVLELESFSADGMDDKANRVCAVTPMQYSETDKQLIKEEDYSDSDEGSGDENCLELIDHDPESDKAQKKHMESGSKRGSSPEENDETCSTANCSEVKPETPTDPSDRDVAEIMLQLRRKNKGPNTHAQSPPKEVRSTDAAADWDTVNSDGVEPMETNVTSDPNDAKKVIDNPTERVTLSNRAPGSDDTRFQGARNGSGSRHSDLIPKLLLQPRQVPEGVRSLLAPPQDGASGMPCLRPNILTQLGKTRAGANTTLHFPPTMGMPARGVGCTPGPLPPASVPPAARKATIPPDLERALKMPKMVPLSVNVPGAMGGEGPGGQRLGPRLPLPPADDPAPRQRPSGPPGLVALTQHGHVRLASGRHPLPAVAPLPRASGRHPMATLTSPPQRGQPPPGLLGVAGPGFLPTSQGPVTAVLPPAHDRSSGTLHDFANMVFSSTGSIMATGKPGSISGINVANSNISGINMADPSNVPVSVGLVSPLAKATVTPVTPVTSPTHHVMQPVTPTAVTNAAAIIVTSQASKPVTSRASKRIATVDVIPASSPQEGSDPPTSAYPPGGSDPPNPASCPPGGSDPHSKAAAQHLGLPELVPITPSMLPRLKAARKLARAHVAPQAKSPDVKEHVLDLSVGPDHAEDLKMGNHDTDPALEGALDLRVVRRLENHFTTNRIPVDSSETPPLTSDGVLDLRTKRKLEELSDTEDEERPTSMLCGARNRGPSRTPLLAHPKPEARLIFESPVMNLSARPPTPGTPTTVAAGPCDVGMNLMSGERSTAPPAARLPFVTGGQPPAVLSSPQSIQPIVVQPEPARPQNIIPQTVQPQAAHLQAAHPQVVQPQAAHLQAAQAQVVQPQAAQPQVVQPQVVQPQDAHLQAAQPQVVQPKAAHLQAAQPQVVQPQAAQPQVAQPQVVQPQAAHLQASQPQVVQPQTAQPQVVQPQVEQPQAAQPQVVQPQAAQPQVARPPAAPFEAARPQVAQAAQPSVVQPQVVQPQIVQPQVVQPQVVQPQAAQPQVVKPQDVQPQVVQPQVVKPQAAQPQVVEPQAAQPQVVKPQIVHPKVVQPQVVQPQVVQPQVVQPQVVQPQVVQPQAAQPQVVQPQAAQPQVVQPQAAQPQVVQPQVVQPQAAQPQAAQPQAAQQQKVNPQPVQPLKIQPQSVGQPSPTSRFPDPRIVRIAHTPTLPARPAQLSSLLRPPMSACGSREVETHSLPALASGASPRASPAPSRSLTPSGGLQSMPLSDDMDAIHHRLVSRVSVVMTPEGKPRVIDIKPLMSPPPGKPALAAAGNTRAEGQAVGQRPVSEGHDPASAPSKVPVKRQPEYEDVTEDEDMDVETDDDTGSSDLEITDETPGLSAAELQERQDKETAAEQLLCLSSDIRTKSSTAAGRKAFGSLSKMDTHPRQRLRPWLEAMIDRGNIPGLQWMDQDRSRFRIPWKHGGKQDWTPENSRIFLEWAKHTGKYREGIDKADYATWKTRLRCAFNKAPDIIEERDLTELNTTEPYRVYKLVPKKADRGRMTLSDPTHSDSDTEMETAPRPAYSPSAVGSMLPLVVEEMAASVKSDMLSSLPSDLKSLAEDDLLRGTITSEGLQLANIEGQDLTNAVISVSHGGVRRTEQLAQPRRAVTSPGVALAQVFPTEDGPCVARVMAPSSSPSSSSASSGPPYVDRGSALARLPVYQKANVTAGPDDAQNVVEVTRYRGHDVDEALDEEHYMELVPQELIPEAMDEEEVEVVVSQTAAVTRNYHQLTQLNPALLSTSVYQGDPVAVTTACLTSTVAGPHCHVMTTLSTGVTGVPGAPLTVEADGSVMMIQQSTQLEQDSGVDIELKFCNETVVRMRMDNVHGCRLASRPPIPPDAAVAQAVYGPENASQIYFPIPQPYHVRQRPDLELQAQLLLKYLERGVLVHYDQGDIYATRLCQCGVHYASEVGTQGAPIKLKRDEHQVKIFDFQGGFMPALTRHAQGLGSPLPSPQVHLQFGQVFDLAKVDNNLLISATITSRLAAQLVQDTGSSEYQASRNNDPDDMIAELQRRVSGVSSTTVQAAPAPAQSPAGHSPPPSPVGNVLPEASSPSSDIYPVTTSPQSRSEVVVITSL